MNARLRRLNEHGIKKFSDWLQQGGLGHPPVALLADPESSDPLPHEITFSERMFSDRYDLGCYLNQLLDDQITGLIQNDRGVWSGLALLLFDQLCPQQANGSRKIDKQYRYILSSDFRHHYRHLVRTPWLLVREHGARSKFLLLSPQVGSQPLGRHGEILEQIGGRQTVLRSRAVIADASELFGDPLTGAARPGVAGRGRGSVRRLAMVLRQLDLTFDLDGLPEGGLLSILPKEFDRWQRAI